MFDPTFKLIVWCYVVGFFAFCFGFAVGACWLMEVLRPLPLP
jgi:hypothetical protein